MGPPRGFRNSDTKAKRDLRAQVTQRKLSIPRTREQKDGELWVSFEMAKYQKEEGGAG